MKHGITRAGTLIGLATLTIGVLSAFVRSPQSTQSSDAAPPPWDDILSPPQGELPEPRDKVVWLGDLSAGFAEAQHQGRPLFVTFRCVPCKQCADFDKDVLEGGSNLDPLLKQFVTVRLTDAQDIDLRLFPVEGFADLDLSWWGWFLSPQGEVYGVFGGRDEVSDTTRISKDALINTLERVLAHHYDPRRADWNIDGPRPDLRSTTRSPRDLPGFESWRERSPGEVRAQSCLHCHQIVEIIRQPAIDAGTFDLSSDLDMWPLPENVGITLDRDHGLLTTAVEPGSAAAQAGVRPGDLLQAADGRRLFGQADFRGVLHRGPRGDGTIELIWRRNDELMTGVLEVQPGWRTTVLDWRTSVSQGNIGVGPGFWPNGANAAERRRRGIERDQMAVKPWFGPNRTGAAFVAGIRHGQVIVAVNGERPNLIGRSFLVWFRMRHDRGDTVTMTVRDGSGGESEITYQLGQPR